MIYDIHIWVVLPRTGKMSNIWHFLSDPGLLVRSMCLVLSNKLSTTPSVNLTDVTLADKETNLILTDKVNRVIQGNVAMQVTQPGGQPSNFGSDVT